MDDLIKLTCNNHRKRRESRGRETHRPKWPHRARRKAAAARAHTQNTSPPLPRAAMMSRRRSRARGDNKSLGPEIKERGDGRIDRANCLAPRRGVHGVARPRSDRTTGGRSSSSRKRRGGGKRLGGGPVEVRGLSWIGERGRTWIWSQDRLARPLTASHPTDTGRYCTAQPRFAEIHPHRSPWGAEIGGEIHPSIYPTGAMPSDPTNNPTTPFQLRQAASS